MCAALSYNSNTVEKFNSVRVNNHEKGLPILSLDIDAFITLEEFLCTFSSQGNNILIMERTQNVVPSN